MGKKNAFRKGIKPVQVHSDINIISCPKFFGSKLLFVLCANLCQSLKNLFCRRFNFFHFLVLLFTKKSSRKSERQKVRRTLAMLRFLSDSGETRSHFLSSAGGNVVSPQGVLQSVPKVQKVLDESDSSVNLRLVQRGCGRCLGNIDDDRNGDSFELGWQTDCSANSIRIWKPLPARICAWEAPHQPVDRAVEFPPEPTSQRPRSPGWPSEDSPGGVNWHNLLLLKMKRDRVSPLPKGFISTVIGSVDSMASLFDLLCEFWRYRNG